jgi:quercetin dioxygenase-like cupin family protein
MNDSKHGLDRRQLLLAGTAGILSELVTSEALAQDPAQAQPWAFRVAFENEFTRVLEFMSRPGASVCGIGKHSHPAHLTVALSDAKVRVTLGDGRQIEAANKFGDVFWSEAGTHTVENIAGPMRALLIEFKAAPRSHA